MKIAYLITTYNNPVHLNKLITALADSDCDIYIHIDKKSTVMFDIPKLQNVYVLENTIKVYWGSFTFVEAVLRLVQKAMSKDDYDYFVLLSGTDYPVRSNKYIRDFITKNKDSQFMNFVKMPENGKPLERVYNYHISTYEKNLQPSNIAKRLSNLLVRKLKLKRKLPAQYASYTLYGGSTWWAMSEECMKYIMNFIKENPTFTKFYAHTLIPEEMFFQTIVGNSKYKSSIKNSFTFADWPQQDLAHPSIIGKEHLALFAQKKVPTTYGESDILFARKFSDEHSEIVKEIDATLRK